MSCILYDAHLKCIGYLLYVVEPEMEPKHGCTGILVIFLERVNFRETEEMN